jgi:hypothetical protein
LAGFQKGEESVNVPSDVIRSMIGRRCFQLAGAVTAKPAGA